MLEVLGADRVCSFEDIPRMPKCDAFIQEIIRFHPPAPLALPRKALIDVTVSKYRCAALSLTCLIPRYDFRQPPATGV